MRRTLFTILIIIAIVSGFWIFVNRDQIHSISDIGRLADDQILSGQGTSFLASQRRTTSENTIRIASFNLQQFDSEKASRIEVVEMLAGIIRKFDVVAVQEIEGGDRMMLRRFLAAINSTGRNYDLVVSSHVGRNNQYERFAFIYDRETILLDGSHSYSVSDPDDVMNREPFVGWFRTTGESAERAFTFSLVNVRLDTNDSERELKYLGKVYQAIRRDGRGEDDIIIAGDFNVDEESLASLRGEFGIWWAISQTPTDTRRTQQSDNIVFSDLATSEFTGQSGVYDFMKMYNLTLDRALQVSDHLPVWGEFTVTEDTSSNQSF